MLASNPLYISPEDYLAAEEISPIRHEYRAGEVFAMTGGTRNHHTLTGNLFFRVRSHLRGSSCRAFIGGMKTRVEASNSFYYPSVVVTCDDRDRRPQSTYIDYPCLIIEVLSPGTERFDRTVKFSDYKTIPSLMEYVLVSTDRQQVQVFQRDDNGEWALSPDTDPIALASVGCDVAIADIYEDTDIPKAEAA